MRQMTSLVPAAALLLCLTPGCGDGGGSTVSLPVDPSRTLDSLTGQEIDAVCDELYRATFAVLNKEKTCMMASHVAAQLKGGDEATCNGYYQICMESELDLTSDHTCSLKQKPQVVEACKATAQELEDCANASLAITQSYVSGLTCASNKALPSTEPPSCAGITAKCPGIW